MEVVDWTGESQLDLISIKGLVKIEAV